MRHQRQNGEPAPIRPAGWAARLRTTSRWSRALAIIAFFVVAAVLYGLWGYWRLNAWLDQGSTEMRHFPIMIVEDGRRLFSSTSDEDRMLNDALLEAQIGRDVRSLSRTEPRLEPYGRYAYVKVFLQTALPGDERRTVPIKFAVRYRWHDDRIQVLGYDTLGL